MSSSIRRRDVLRGMFGLATAAVAAQIVAACGQQASPAAPAKTDSASSKPADAKPAGDAKPTTAAPAAAGKTAGAELVYLNQSRGQAKAMEALAERYNGQQTAVKVTIDSPGPIDYPKKLQASSQAGNMPDAYYALSQAEMAPYYKAGWALDLKPEMDKGWNKNFSPGLLDFQEFRDGNSLGVKPGIYAAPWEVNTYGMLFNPALFEKAGLDAKTPPATTSEWLAGLNKLKAANVGPFAMAFDFIPRFTQTYATSWMKDEEIDATLAGKASYKADGWRKSLQLFIDMRDAGVVFNNTLNATNPDLEKSFFNVQELAMFWTGVFSVPVQVTTAPQFTAYSGFPLPKGEGATLEPRTYGGTGKNGVVNAKGKQVEESIKYIKWLTEKEQEQTFMEMVPLIPTNPAALDPSKISPQLSMFAGLADKIQKVYSPMSAPVNEAFIKGVQSMLLKEKTIDQVLDDADLAQKG